MELLIVHISTIPQEDHHGHINSTTESRLIESTYHLYQSKQDVTENDIHCSVHKLNSQLIQFNPSQHNFALHDQQTSANKQVNQIGQSPLKCALTATIQCSVTLQSISATARLTGAKFNYTLQYSPRNGLIEFPNRCSSDIDNGIKPEIEWEVT